MNTSIEFNPSTSKITGAFANFMKTWRMLGGEWKATFEKYSNRDVTQNYISITNGYITFNSTFYPETSVENVEIEINGMSGMESITLEDSRNIFNIFSNYKVIIEDWLILQYRLENYEKPIKKIKTGHYYPSKEPIYFGDIVSICASPYFITVLTKPMYIKLVVDKDTVKYFNQDWCDFIVKEND